MSGPLEVLAAAGGSASFAELRRSCGRRALERAVEDGEVVRAGHGAYALAFVAASHRIALECGAVLYGRSAALALGIGVLHRPRPVELAVARGIKVRPRPSAAIVTRLLPPQDLWHVGMVSATSPTRTVLDCAAALPFAEGLAIADSALRRGLVTPEGLEAAAATWTGRNRQAQRRVLEHMDARAANPFESGLRAACLEAGVVLRPQMRIMTAGGPYVVDLGSEDTPVVTEADSFEWHGGRENLHRDCTRYNELVRAGRVVLRFSWEHIMGHRAWVGAVVADVTRAYRHKSARKRAGMGPFAA
ncbi:very-short-patch-repair endonuclease [Sinomonas atrocyanea]|uniref:hypothetical protein n=1 Tax=Sinomonas atrocyanea TaxID=37927 RepID=UPI002789615F|nr:hypothetical protein [Sinomonas atrocyanea]MDP9885677.1 very-short-patch-repair endonuclease [Sinomonas atrocyanea]